MKVTHLCLAPPIVDIPCKSGEIHDENHLCKGHFNLGRWDTVDEVDNVTTFSRTRRRDLLVQQVTHGEPFHQLSSVRHLREGRPRHFWTSQGYHNSIHSHAAEQEVQHADAQTQQGDEEECRDYRRVCVGNIGPRGR